MCNKISRDDGVSCLHIRLQTCDKNDKIWMLTEANTRGVLFFFLHSMWSDELNAVKEKQTKTFEGHKIVTDKCREERHF